MIELGARRDPRDVEICESTAFAERLERLSARVDAQAALPVPCEADAAASKISRQPDQAATTKARRKARKALRDRLPAIADELLRLSNVVRHGRDALDDEKSLAALASALERLMNRRGCLSGDKLRRVPRRRPVARRSVRSENGDYLYACDAGDEQTS